MQNFGSICILSFESLAQTESAIVGRLWCTIRRIGSLRSVEETTLYSINNE